MFLNQYVSVCSSSWVLSPGWIIAYTWASFRLKYENSWSPWIMQHKRKKKQRVFITAHRMPLGFKFSLLHTLTPSDEHCKQLSTIFSGRKHHRDRDTCTHTQTHTQSCGGGGERLLELLKSLVRGRRSRKYRSWSAGEKEQDCREMS